MTQDLFSTLIPIALIGLIALVVGVVIGFLLAGLSNQSTQEKKDRSKSLFELARLWRDRASGKVMVEMSGKMFDAPDEMRADQKAALSKALDELQLWLDVDDLVARAINEPVSSPLPEPSPLVSSESSPATPTAVSVISASAATKAIPHPAEPEVKPPSMQIGDIFSQVFSSEKSKTAIKPVKSIAAQVDEIIQEKLPDSPFKNRIISVTDLPGRGLLVRVDDLSYEGIGDVADEEIRQFLRECVAEWERRSDIA
jgi:hypothetical protein